MTPDGVPIKGEVKSWERFWKRSNPSLDSQRSARFYLHKSKLRIKEGKHALLAKRKAEPKAIMGGGAFYLKVQGLGSHPAISSLWGEQARQSSGTPGKGFASAERWRVGGTHDCSNPARAQPAPRVPGIGPRSLAEAASLRAAVDSHPRSANQPSHSLATVPTPRATRLPGARSRVCSGPRQA